MTEDVATLKRLEFIKSYGSYVTYAADTADKVYKSTRSYTPKFVEPYVTGVEDRVVAYAAPVVTAVQDTADKALRTADTKLDTTLSTLWNSYESGRSYFVDKTSAVTTKQANLQASAKDHVLKVVEQAVDIVHKQRAALSSAAASATDSVRNAVEYAKTATESNTELALDKVASTWSYLLSFPAVVKLLEVGSPALDFAKPYYATAHKTVVAHPGYRYVYNVSKGVVERVQETSLYKTSEGLLYPLVAPVATPVLKKVTASPLYQQVVQELQPAAPAPAPQASQPVPTLS
jgi:hypothetical protein